MFFLKHGVYFLHWPTYAYVVPSNHNWV